MGRVWLLTVLVLGLLVPVGVLSAAGSGPPGSPLPPVDAPASVPFSSPSLPHAAVHPAATPPPPPYDWDYMWFNANNSTGVSAAGGDGAKMAVDDPGDFAIMYGGETSRGGISNATWLVNETSAVWYLLKTPVAPSPRTGFALASGGTCGWAILFGGEVNARTHQATNDTWLFNYSTKSWTNVTGSVGPAPRSGAALAVDDRSCRAVLYGGADLYYNSGNSTGSVRWNDTWVFSLANRTWTPLAPTGTPPSVSDAGFVFDNQTGVFLLYGGCESLCSGAIWNFRLSTMTWSARPAAPSAPVGRGGMAWVYGWAHDVAVLSMGYTLDGSTRSPLNDTWVYEIGNNRWDPVGEPNPSPRYDVAAGWLGSNGCPGMVLVGGALAPTNPPDQWFLDEAPDLSLQCNTWGNDSISTGGGGIGSGCDFGFYVLVNVSSFLTGGPVAGANVSVTGNCSRSSIYSDANGQALFAIAYAPYTVTVTDPLYHDNATGYFPAVSPVFGQVNLSLVPLPDLTIQTFQLGVDGNRTVLGNVTITAGTARVYLGTTNNTTGLYRQAGFWPLGLFELFSGNRTGWGDVDNNSPIPYTGNWTVNLTLPAPGPLEVRVVEDRSGAALAGAVVTVANIPTEPRAGFKDVTSPSGWANGTLTAGNFTATARLAGFAQVRVLPVFYHPWAKVTVVTINMTSDTGYTVDVRVLDARTLLPLPGSNVQVGAYPPQSTGPSGWTNLSGIRPAGAYEVVAWHANYTTNRTAVLLSYTQPIWVVTFKLSPLRPCTGPGAGCVPGNTTPTGIAPLSLWPATAPTLTLLAGGGVLLFALPATALILARRRGGPGRGREPKE